MIVEFRDGARVPHKELRGFVKMALGFTTKDCHLLSADLRRGAVILNHAQYLALNTVIGAGTERVISLVPVPHPTLPDWSTTVEQD